MKKHLLFVFIIISSISFGQGLNAELGIHDDYKDEVQAVVCDNEFTYLTYLKRYANSFLSQSILSKIDTLGNTVWSIPISPINAETTIVNDLLIGSDGNIYISGFALPTCDVADVYLFVQKYNSNGLSKWTSLWHGSPTNQGLMNKPYLNDSKEVLVNIATQDSSRIYKIDSLGSKIDSLTIFKSNLDEILCLDSDTIIGFKADSLFAFNSQGITLDSIVFNSPIQNILFINDTIFILTNDSIFSYSSSLQRASANSFTGFCNYSNLKFINNNLAFISSDSINQNISTINSQLQKLSTFNLLISVPNNAEKDFSQSHLSIAYDYFLTKHKSIRYLDYSFFSKNSVIINSTDIGIIDIIPTSIYAVETSYDTSVYSIQLEANITIKNYGINILNYCRINHEIQAWGICNSIVYTNEFYSLNILPGDTAIITCGIVHQEMNYFTGDSINVNVCFYTSNPNGFTDLNVSNDSYCEKVHFGMVAIEDISKEDISVFPNPTTGIINVQLPKNSKAKYNIFDLQGRVLESGELHSQQIDISSFSKGMYFLKISFENGNYEINKTIIKN